jgi:hypothetical protein
MSQKKQAESGLCHLMRHGYLNLWTLTITHPEMVNLPDIFVFRKILS